jgi:hypothetical protein
LWGWSTKKGINPAHHHHLTHGPFTQFLFGGAPPNPPTPQPSPITNHNAQPSSDCVSTIRWGMGKRSRGEQWATYIYMAYLCVYITYIPIVFDVCKIWIFICIYIPVILEKAYYIHVCISIFTYIRNQNNVYIQTRMYVYIHAQTYIPVRYIVFLCACHPCSPLDHLPIPHRIVLTTERGLGVMVSDG